MCYYDLKELVSFVSENRDEIRQANQLFKEITGEKELIHWVLKYETVYKRGTLDLLFMKMEDGDKIYFKRPNQYMFSGELFTEAMKFMVTFLNNNTQLLEKYSIFSADEESELYSPKNKDLDTDKISSLRFHLELEKNLKKWESIFLSIFKKKKNSGI